MDAEFLYPLRHLSGLFIPRLGGRDGGSDGPERNVPSSTVAWRPARSASSTARPAVLMAVGFADLRSAPLALLFSACAADATGGGVGDGQAAGAGAPPPAGGTTPDKKFNLDGYVCLQYSLLWGAAGHGQRAVGQRPAAAPLRASCQGWLLHARQYGSSLTVAVLDQIGSAVLAVSQYAARHPVLEQLNLETGEAVGYAAPAGSSLYM